MDEEIIGEQVNTYSEKVYGGDMPVNNKNTMRDIIKKEFAYEEMREARLEARHKVTGSNA